MPRVSQFSSRTDQSRRASGGSGFALANATQLGVQSTAIETRAAKIGRKRRLSRNDHAIPAVATASALTTVKRENLADANGCPHQTSAQTRSSHSPTAHRHRAIDELRAAKPTAKELEKIQIAITEKSVIKVMRSTAARIAGKRAAQSRRAGGPSTTGVNTIHKYTKERLKKHASAAKSHRLALPNVCEDIVTHNER